MGILLCEQNFRNVWIRNESVRAEIGQILHTDTHPHTHTHTTAAKLVVRISIDTNFLLCLNTRCEACRGRKITYLNPQNLSYLILNCSVDLLQLQTTFPGSAFQGMTTRCEKKFLRGSRFNLSL